MSEYLSGAPRQTACEETAALLEDICHFIRRFVVLSESQVIALALFVMESHIFDRFECAPYLHVTSAEKQCGKTRLLEVLELLVCRPWLTGKITAAALVRKVSADRPTLLLDESDAAFAGEKEYSEALRGVLNAGHRRGGRASLCVGKGAEINVVDFDVFCPKVIAGIGKLPDTVADRSIPIHLKRKRPEESAERFRRKFIGTEASQLSDRLTAWASSEAIAVQAASLPELPEQLSDRQQDIAEPLVSIADMAGTEWAGRARTALVELLCGKSAADDSLGVRLLADIWQIFEETKAERLSSRELVGRLTALEGAPWEDINHGRQITPTVLARQLRGFGIEPRNMRDADGVVKGYHRNCFEDAWARYLRPYRSGDDGSNATPLQAAPALHKPAVAMPLQRPLVADGANAQGRTNIEL